MREALQEALLAFVDGSDVRGFDTLAAEVVRYQAARIPAYGRLVAARGGFDGDWRSAPLVPTDLFRDLDLCASDPGASMAATFVTSGTTTGRRGTRRVPDLTLYHRGMLAPFCAAVLAGDSTPRPWLSLVPHPDVDPTSSLSHMVGGLAASLATETTWSMTPEGLDVAAATAFALAAQTPVVVLTTAFALIHWLDGATDDLRPLPPGSRMMLTGGYKGRARQVDETDLLAMIETRLGLGAEAVVPEYGMTELTSQAYGRPFRAPPWLRIRVVDPTSGVDLPVGKPGLVAFFDLLNLDNVSALLTGDVGQVDAQGRLTLLGRAEGAALRGCSLTA
ncbi:MAG: hypothetical protein QF464_02545, partial [Myxococcota bacterium]|nr:hypothetical protein [Myxococcota bacterium]